MARLGCLLLVAVAAWLSLECWVFLLAAQAIGQAWFGSGLAGILPLLVVVVLCIFIGVRTAKRNASRIVAGLLQGTAGRHAVAALGGVLLAIPGIILKLPALLLLLPPIQRLLGGLGQLVLAAVVRRQMGRMFGGAMPVAGFPGGMPFPGMAPVPSTPDERRPFARAARTPKTIDTTAERP